MTTLETHRLRCAVWVRRTELYQARQEAVGVVRRSVAARTAHAIAPRPPDPEPPPLRLAVGQRLVELPQPARQREENGCPAG